MTRKIVKCSTCGAPMFWIKMAGSGASNPIDAEPCPDGNIVIIGDKASALTKEQLRSGIVEGLKYKSHFATCPQSRQHRKVQ